MTDLELARCLAAKFHADQKYGNMPYTFHLADVDEAVTPHGDERLRIIAWLHDIVEDTQFTLEMVNTIFGGEIFAAVFAITRGKSENEGDYLARCKSNPLAHVVKMQDSFCNLQQSMLDGDMKRIKRYATKLQILAS